MYKTKLNNDFKPIVASTYLPIINATLEKILFSQIDNILKDITLLYIDTESQDFDYKEIIITDLFPIYTNIWKSNLELLYENYLPNIDYQFEWGIEITPYTLMLCELTKEGFKSKELELLKKSLKITDEDIEIKYEEILEKLGLEKSGVEKSFQNKIPASLFPKTRKEQLVLLFRLMNFPPLSELSLFQHLFNASLVNNTKELSVAFSSLDSKKIPSFGMNHSLLFSYYHFDHQVYKKYGLDGFKKRPWLLKYKDDFESIRKIASKDAGKLHDHYICPCCGEEQLMDLPSEAIEYMLLIKNQKIAIDIGLDFYENFKQSYKNKLSTELLSLLPNINKVDNPECLILVEGESEEVSIPILALKLGFILSQQLIQVYNSKSKEKLLSDFFTFKEKYPKRKMICLLDSDAVKERDDLQRVIENNKNIYRLVFIEKGSFEDIFDLELSIVVINELYPSGENIDKTDFIASKDFLTNIKKALYTKKKSTFDKVLFAKKISSIITSNDIPKEIVSIIDLAKKFTKSKTFLEK